MTSPNRCGRIASPVDPRDRTFQMEPPVVKRARSRHWWVPAGVLDQGDRPHCVAYAWTSMLRAAPETASVPRVGLFTAALYERAQLLDDVDAGPEDGTTVRGAAKALSRAGIIGGYRWAYRAATVRDYLLTRGPVVLGLPWYDGMDAEKMWNVGAYLGGHAVLATGFSQKHHAVRILNSWGPKWAARGRAWLPLSVLDMLLQEGGEACSAIETRYDAPLTPSVLRKGAT
jgi:hypothetical protein